MRSTMKWAAAVALIGAAASADAAPIVYNLALTGNPGSNPMTGSGSFTIEGTTFQGTGNEFFRYSGSPDVLLDLRFTIDGRTFDLADSLGGDQVFFQNGALQGITYQGIDGGNIQISLNAGALSYIYSNTTNQHTSVGTITARLAPPAVPEPATWGMMLLGFASIGYVARRRRTDAARIRFA